MLCLITFLNCLLSVRNQGWGCTTGMLIYEQNKLLEHSVKSIIAVLKLVISSSVTWQSFLYFTVYICYSYRNLMRTAYMFHWTCIHHCIWCTLHCKYIGRKPFNMVCLEVADGKKLCMSQNTLYLANKLILISPGKASIWGKQSLYNRKLLWLYRRWTKYWIQEYLEYT